MKCPKCNSELRESKKTPGYYLCDSCKKKFSQETLARFKYAKSSAKNTESSDEQEIPETLEQPIADKEPGGTVYSNIPPEHIRQKREKEMRENYEALLNIKEDHTPLPKEENDTEGPGSFDDEEASCRGFRLLIGILSLLGAVYLGYVAFSSGNVVTFIHTQDLTGTASMLLAVCLLIGGIITLGMQAKNSITAFLLPALFFIGGSAGSAFLPGSSLIVKILIYATAAFGVFMIFCLCCAKKIHVALRILILVLLLALAGGGVFAAQKFVVKETFGSKNTLRLVTDNFTAIYEKTDIAEDYEGMDSLLVYYTITNKGEEPLVPSVAVTFKAMQDSTTLESTLVPDEKLTENESKEIKKGDSVRVCTSFRLIDRSDITLQVSESFASDGKQAETTISID